MTRPNDASFQPAQIIATQTYGFAPGHDDVHPWRGFLGGVLFKHRAPALLPNNDKNITYPEKKKAHQEEVGQRGFFSIVPAEGQPTPPWIVLEWCVSPCVKPVGSAGAQNRGENSISIAQYSEKQAQTVPTLFLF
ncbi:MAG: hypothetical protein LBB65_02435 [Burkholderiales bacterium]|nr:hypothetical protein [Burkholderiales bacterium]